MTAMWRMASYRAGQAASSPLGAAMRPPVFRFFVVDEPLYRRPHLLHDHDAPVTPDFEAGPGYLVPRSDR